MDFILGVEAAFKKDAFFSKMRDFGCYVAGMNMLDENYLYCAVGGIPINKLAVKSVCDTVFKTPVRFPGMLIIALESTQESPMKRRGGLMSLTPEELRHAYYLAIARDLQDKSFAADQKQAWKNNLLSVAFEFRVYATAEERCPQLASIS